MIGNYNYGTGRRKSAVARVFIKPGNGKIVVNDKPVDEFFARETGRMVVRQPLVLTNHETTFDIMVNVDRRRRIRPGRRGAPRHHARADRLRRGAEAGAVEGRARHARRARSGAQEGRPAQGAPPQAVLEALTQFTALFRNAKSAAAAAAFVGSCEDRSEGGLCLAAASCQWHNSRGEC